MTGSCLFDSEGMSDPELRMVLELATDEELMEFEEILYGTRFDFLLVVLMLCGTEINNWVCGLVGSEIISLKFLFAVSCGVCCEMRINTCCSIGYSVATFCNYATVTVNSNVL